MDEIARSIAHFALKSKGTKPVVCVAESLDTASSVYLSSLGSHVVVQPSSSVNLTGVASSSFFFKNFLERHGIVAQVEQRKDYKTAAEPLTNEAYSASGEEVARYVVDKLSSAIKRSVARSRAGGDEDAVEEMMRVGSMSVDEAIRRGIVHRAGYVQDFCMEYLRGDDDDADCAVPLMYPKMKKGAPKRKKNDPIVTNMAMYASKIHRTMKLYKKKRGPYVAMIPLEGTIRSGRSRRDGASGIAADDAVGVLHAACEDPLVKAVVLRIDSPGGSATASEKIGQSVVRLRESGKPVIACLGNVAASGGYWIAAHCDHIIATYMTITGSIGVVGGKLAFGKMLESFGVTADGVASHDAVVRNQVYDAWTEAQRESVAKRVDEMYDAFVRVVAEGRKMSVEDVEAVAGGRIFFGDDAKEVGLVDTVGGLYDAHQLAWNLSSGAPLPLRLFPPTKSTFAHIASLVTGGIEHEQNYPTGASASLRGEALDAFLGDSLSMIRDETVREALRTVLGPSSASMLERHGSGGGATSIDAACAVSEDLDYGLRRS